MTIGQFEVGRACFTSYVYAEKEQFENARFHLNDTWKYGREVPPEVGASLPYPESKLLREKSEAATDNNLVEQLMATFMDTFCKTAAERESVGCFFRERIAQKIAKKHRKEYLNLTTKSSAFMRILWRSTKPKNIDNSLYYGKISSELLEQLQKYIASLSTESAIEWKDRSGLTRKTFEFGVSFKELEDNKRIVTTEMPPELVAVRNVLVQLFKDHLTEKSAELYENCIVTVYAEGDGIKAHTDRSYFGPDILGLIIEPDSRSALTFISPDSKNKIQLIEKAGRAFLFQGLLRNDWKHELAPVATKRITVQFRTVNGELL